MREQLRRHGIAESTELPDHLTYLLPLIARMDREHAAQLARESILPALAKVKSALKDNPYEPTIAAIEEKLAADFGQAKCLPYLPIFQEAACE
jgi:nitrate reductase assembly molybdenum cofactor insertion protein NarJ